MLKINSEEIYIPFDFTGETGVFGMQNCPENAPQCSVVKDSIVKDSIVKDSSAECSVGNASVFAKSTEEKKTAEKTEQTTTQKTTIDRVDDFFDFEEINCDNPNITTIAEFAMLNNSHNLSEYMNSLTEKQKARYKRFLINLYSYLTVNKIKIDAPAFIKYNEERSWLGRGGESVIKNYKKYIYAWEKNDYALNKK